MGRKLGSKDKKPRKRREVAPLPPPLQEPPPPVTICPPSAFKEYIPPKKTSVTYRERPRKKVKVTSLIDKRKQTEYREYCIAIVNMAQRQGVLGDLMHLMHAFKLILQGHHEGMSADHPFPQKSIISLSELTELLKKDSEENEG